MEDHNFKFDSDNIPVNVAIAIYNVMHGEDTYKEWDLFDKMISKKKPLMDWIKSVLTDNDQDGIEKELEWWNAELFGGAK